MKKNTYWLAFWIVYTLSFFAKCFYFQFTTELNTIPLFSAENAGMLLSYTGILLLCTGLLLLLTSRRRAAAQRPNPPRGLIRHRAGRRPPFNGRTRP